jgi:hypothetical protein
MKGIYLTEEAKAEIKAKIAEIETGLKTLSLTDGFKDMGMLSVYKEILLSATILPVEKDYCYIQEKYFDEIKKDDSPDTKLVEILQENFKNGVIIQPKQ